MYCASFELIEFQPKSRKTDIAQALKFYQELKKKKAIVFVISDFMSRLRANVENCIKKTRHHRHTFTIFAKKKCQI
jgi:hypothetical protein